MNIPINKIIVEDRFRKELSSKASNEGQQTDIVDLALSIKMQGLINPITVKENNDGTYRLLAGGRRLEAVKTLQWVDIPATVYPVELSEVQQLEVELMENLARKDLTWQEEIALKKHINDIKLGQLGYKTRSNPNGHTQEKTAQLLGESPATVSQDIQLAEMLEQFPEIGNVANSKKEAAKFLDSMVKKYQRKKAADAVQAKTADTPVAKQRRKLCDSFIVADFFEAIKKYEDGTFHLINLDPPWGIDLDEIKKESMVTKKVEDKAYKEVKTNYLKWLEPVLRECYRVAKANSWLLLWYDIKIHSDIVSLCKHVGWEVGLDIPAIWIKHSGQTQAQHRYLGRSWEPFLYIRKGRVELVKQGRLDVFDYAGVPQKRHRAEKPIEMMEDIISTFANIGNNILDPFLGSGNTILAANNHGCECVGFDLGQENKDGFVLKVESQEPRCYSSYNVK